MEAYEKFLFDLKRKFDLDLTGYKRPQMERRINTLMRTLDIPDYDAFVLAMSNDKKLLDRFIDHLTINVSEFFRNPTQWEVLQKKDFTPAFGAKPEFKDMECRLFNRRRTVYHGDGIIRTFSQGTTQNSGYRF